MHAETFEQRLPARAQPAAEHVAVGAVIPREREKRNVAVTHRLQVGQVRAAPERLQELHAIAKAFLVGLQAGAAEERQHGQAVFRFHFFRQQQPVVFEADPSPQPAAPASRPARD